MKDITIIQPDDWHVHLRENKILTAVVKYTASKFGKCIAMPNLESPIISWQMAEKYKKEIINCSGLKDFKPFIPWQSNSCLLSTKDSMMLMTIRTLKKNPYDRIRPQSAQRR